MQSKDKRYRTWVSLWESRVMIRRFYGFDYEMNVVLFAYIGKTGHKVQG